MISGQWIWSEWAAEVRGGEKPGDCQGVDGKTWRKINSKTFSKMIWWLMKTLMAKRAFNTRCNIAATYPLSHALLYLPGVGIEDWFFYSCVGERAGSYAWAAQNLAQHVPGLNPAFCIHVWLLCFFKGGQCSAIPEHNWKRKSSCVWGSGAFSLLSLWRQLSIFLQFCLQVNCTIC